MNTQPTLPGLDDAILANLRNRIRAREVELSRHGCHNTNSHLKHFHVMHLSDVIDEVMLGEYLEHLMEIDERG